MVVDYNCWSTGDYSHVDGQTSYTFNVEAMGYGKPLSSQTPAPITGHLRAAGYIPAMANATQLMILCDGKRTAGFPQGNVWEMSAPSTPGTLADCYNQVNGAVGVFDLLRHRGKINVLFLDGHVENLTILNTGGTTTGAGVTASGDLANVIMNKDFPQQ